MRLIVFNRRVSITKRNPTKRAADKWDSARFSSLFLASSFVRLSSRVASRPLAANANRWALGFVRLCKSILFESIV